MQIIQRRSFLLLLLFLMNVDNARGQEKFCREFKKLSCPEKKWVIFHPFIAKKTFHLTQLARAVAKEMKSDSLLDGDENGGQIDAFRHAYWMALLSQRFCWRKAMRLGKSHEKGDYLKFKKGKLEEGALPDSVSGEMDLFNNRIGIEIGRANKKLAANALKQAVRDSILAGKMMVIRKNPNGDSVDCEGHIIDARLHEGKWNIPKCLINSDYRHRQEK
jgi:hypothetical protein